jgi:5-formyltetrahydrofolate cyclo-ligase
MVVSLTELKKKARRGAADRRNAAHQDAFELAPAKLLDLEFPVLTSLSTRFASGFYPTQSEIDVRPLMGKLAGEGWTTCLPVVIARGEPLAFRRWYPGEPTMTGQWNIPRPSDQSPLVEPDVLLVPMLAFDRKGYRLGYGGGFYDRTLAKFRAKKTIVAIGVAYAAQVIDAVPRDDHDQPLDYIMTEKEVFRCG